MKNVSTAGKALISLAIIILLFNIAGSIHFVKAYSYDADQYGHSFIYSKTCSQVEGHSRFSVFDQYDSGCKAYNKCTPSYDAVLDVVCVDTQYINSQAAQDYPGKRCSSFVAENGNDPYRYEPASSFGTGDLGSVRVLTCSGGWGNGKCEDTDKYGNPVNAHCCLEEGGSIQYLKDHAYISPMYTDLSALCCDGLHATNGHCCGNGEVWSDSQNSCVPEDNTAPTTTINPKGHGWTNQDVPFSLSCSDSGSGCDKTYYKIIDAGDSCSSFGYTEGSYGTVTCPSGSVCEKRVCYYSKDNAGNVESVKESDVFYIDKTKPFTEINPNGESSSKNIPVSLTPSDTGSGVSQTYYKIINYGGQCGSSGYTAGTDFTISCPSNSVCEKQVCYYSVDNAGNKEDVKVSNLFKINKTTPNHCPEWSTNFIYNQIKVGEYWTLNLGAYAYDVDGDSLTYHVVGSLPYGASLNSYSGLVSWTPSSSQVGLHKMYFYVFDGKCSSSNLEVDVNVVQGNNNHKPVVNNVFITPSSPFTFDNLTCHYSFSDADNDPDESSVFWFINGVKVNFEGDVLPHYFTKKGDSVLCEVVPFDGKDYGVSVNSSPVVIRNSCPRWTVSTLGTYHAVVGHQLVVDHLDNYVVDADDDNLLYSSDDNPQRSYVVTIPVPALLWTPADNQVGTYNFHIIVSDGTCRASVPITVVVSAEHHNQPPVASFTANVTQGCAPLEVKFDASSSYDPDGSISSYVWDFGDLTNGYGRVIVHAFTAPGSYAVKLTVTDNEGASSTHTEYITVNNCRKPVAILNANPTYGYAPLTVHFDTSRSTGNIVQYCLYYGDNQHECSSSPIIGEHTYTLEGNYTATLIVKDNYGNTDEDSVVIHVRNKPLQLNVTSITCFKRITVGNNQSCSVTVRDDKGNRVPDALVTIYFDNGNLFGVCHTDTITGECSALKSMNQRGHYRVYATAEKSGFISDTDKIPTFDFDVMAKRYTISDLRIFNDSNFTQEDDVFYRGENMYVSFKVTDDYTGKPVDGIVSQVTLVSPPGGRINLSFIRDEAGVYYYKLTPIPPTHEFLGNSQVFSFVFNFTDNTSGQMQAPVTILNNPPEIRGLSNLTILRGTTYTVDLSHYEFDVEDSGNNLTWEVTQYTNSLFSYTLNGKILTIKAGNREGVGEITLRLYDLDGDYDQKTVKVTVKRGVNHAPYFISTPITSVRAGSKYVYYPVAVDPDGDPVKYALLNAPKGMTLRTDANMVVWNVPLSYIGREVNVSIIASDPYGLYAVQSYTIKVEMPAEQRLPRRRVYVSELRIRNADCLKAGDDLVADVNFKNLGFYDLKDVKIRAVVHSIDDSRQIGPISVGSGQDISKVLLMHLDDSVKPGVYFVRFTIYNSKIRRVLYREFTVVNSCECCNDQ